jgi:Ca2+-binding RTX toxin-like protein
VAAGGDINGDGFADLVLGASVLGPTDSAGESFVLFGGNFTGDALLGADGDDILTAGGSVPPNLVGGLGNDLLVGDGLANALRGGAGQDVLVGDSGNDHLDGGSGFDIADFSGSYDGVTVTLGTELRQSISGGQGSDIITNVEGVIGSGHNDVIVGDGATNLIVGAAGNDTLDGGAGSDFVDGGTGVNFLKGGDGNDILRGGLGFTNDDFNTADYRSAGSFDGLAVNLGAIGLAEVDGPGGNADLLIKIDGIVEELYDVVALPGVRRPMALGFKTDEIRHMVLVGDEQKI